MSVPAFCFIVLQIFAVVVVADESNNFVYYKNLWLENVDKAKQWKQPTESSQFKNILLDRCKPIEKSYDFVIVGGGTAGSVLANRLSANSKWNVLVIEAGGNETEFSLIPGAYLTAIRSEMNWAYLTEPQQNACRRMPNSQCPMPRGRVLGGESAVKDVTYVRGNLQDFKSWGHFWSSRALKYFKVMENATSLDTDRSDEKYRGTHGNFHIEYPKVKGHLTDEIFKGHEELGLKILQDYNGESQIGVSNMQAYTKQGKRGSTNQGYLQPVIERTNLKVLINAMATKIIFKRTCGKHKNALEAKQLQFLNGNECYVVNITKELILTSGPINTPQLLMLSGVGPENELKRHNISIVQEMSAVGQHLQDHIAFRLSIGINKTYGYRKFDDELTAYLKDGSGSLGEPYARQVSFAITDKERSSVPNFEMMFVEANPQVLYPPSSNLNEPVELNQFSVQILHLHPKSEGSITLRSSDPTDYPIIDPQYLHSEHDMRAWVKIFEFMTELIRTKTFREMNATFVDFVPEACKNETGADQLICIIKQQTLPMHHQIGTCRMGANMKHSCVSEELLVHGTSNLRVVDGSVIQEGTSGHTIPVIIMIAEVISDLIRRIHKDC